MAQSKIFRGTARAILTDSGVTSYIYHRTAVVKKNHTTGVITLNSGGFQTRTTKLAMNQASNQDRLGFTVIQRNYDWYVMWGGRQLCFKDGMELLPNCEVNS